ncbi:MAG: anthranilate synthase component I [Candidatus Omnitrophica bacterium]|nr:anthranilate synthase component I [Candidatus Omnitrophota bacterium]
MTSPDKKRFLKLARRGNLIPVFRKIPARGETPVSLFERIRHMPNAYLLESVEGSREFARYSFMGFGPRLVISSKGRKAVIEEDGVRRSLRISDPLEVLKRYLSGFKYVPTPGLPRFSGGFVGYMGYDCVRFWERLPDDNPDDLKLPDTLFILTDTLLIFDHLRKEISVVSNVRIKSARSASVLKKRYEETLLRIDEIVKLIHDPGSKLNRPRRGRRGAGAMKISSDFSRAAFEKQVRRAKEYIHAGDVVQVVLSQRFRTSLGADPFLVYRKLRVLNPSPYMYYLSFGPCTFIGTSPELLVRCEGDRVRTRPIAGTRPRGRGARADGRLARELLQDPKERAEHVMLVDLGRNDLGRVSRFGSVRVEDFMRIERFSHVMHIVSDVKAKLASGRGRMDLIRAAFPAGTVTGAPKVRAMEIIDELEHHRRGPYAGMVGYFGFSGNFDTCIMIRTIIVKGRTAYVQAGAGIVADSVPAREYEETVNKAKALFKAIEMARK